MLTLFKVFARSLFPERCLGCGRPDELICNACELKLRPSVLPDYPRTLSVFSYQDPVIRAAIQKLKYRNRTPLAQKLASLVAPHLLDEIAEMMPLEEFSAPLLVPVPISKSRRRKRGYNHAALLAKALAQETGFSYNGEVVEKIRDTESQVSMKNRRERLANLRGAFRGHDKKVWGRNCIIVDDVTTTGTTLAEMRKALERAQAKNIFAVTIAH